MDNQTTEQQVAQSDPAVETTTDQSQTSVLSTEEQSSDINFKELIPDEYKEDKALANFQDMNQFVKSNLHAQKMVGLS